MCGEEGAAVLTWRLRLDRDNHLEAPTCCLTCTHDSESEDAPRPIKSTPTTSTSKATSKGPRMHCWCASLSSVSVFRGVGTAATDEVFLVGEDAALRVGVDGRPRRGALAGELRPPPPPLLGRTGEGFGVAAASSLPGSGDCCWACLRGDRRRTTPPGDEAEEVPLPCASPSALPGRLPTLVMMSSGKEGSLLAGNPHGRVGISLVGGVPVGCCGGGGLDDRRNKSGCGFGKGGRV